MELQEALHESPGKHCPVPRSRLCSVLWVPAPVAKQGSWGKARTMGVLGGRSSLMMMAGIALSPVLEGWLSWAEHHQHAESFQWQQQWERVATPLPVYSHNTCVSDSPFSTVHWWKRWPNSAWSFMFYSWPACLRFSLSKPCQYEGPGNSKL